MCWLQQRDQRWTAHDLAVVDYNLGCTGGALLGCTALECDINPRAIEQQSRSPSTEIAEAPDFLGPLADWQTGRLVGRGWYLAWVNSSARPSWGRGCTLVTSHEVLAQAPPSPVLDSQGWQRAIIHWPWMIEGTHGPLTHLMLTRPRRLLVIALAPSHNGKWLAAVACGCSCSSSRDSVVLVRVLLNINRLEPWMKSGAQGKRRGRFHVLAFKMRRPRANASTGMSSIGLSTAHCSSGDRHKCCR